MLRCKRAYRSHYGIYAVGQTVDDPQNEAWLKRDDPDAWEDPGAKILVEIKPAEAEAIKPTAAPVIKRAGRPPKLKR